VLLVLLVALGNSRLALVSAVAVPVALIGSITVLRLTGSSINTLTLFGMVLATGLVVDDAIVVSEDIGRRLEAGESPMRAARNAMQELGGAVIATSLVLVVVFLPVLAIPGSVGRLYQPIAITIGATILFSTLNALTFTPVAASWLLGHGWKEPDWLSRLLQRPQRWLDRLRHWYGKALERSFRRRRLVLLGLLGGLVLAGWGLGQLPTGFIPQEDDSQVRGVVVLPGGASLRSTERVVEKVRQVVAEEKLVRVGNFYAGRSFGRQRPKQRHLLPAPTTAGAAGQRQRKQQRSHRPTAGGGHARTDPRGHGAAECPSPRAGIQQRGGLELELLDISGGRLNLSDFEAEVRSFIAAANATDAFERVSTRFSADAPLRAA